MNVNQAIRRDGRGSLGIATSPIVVGPDGYPMTAHDLPPRDTTRWVVRRKAQVVLAVEAGLIMLKDACDRYSLTPEEFASWKRAIERHGVRGLRVTHLKQYRESDKPQRTNNTKV